MKFDKRKSAFTMIELLVVISILSFIISFVTGSTVYLVKKARLDRTKVFMRNIATSIQLYNDQFHKLPEFDGDSQGCGSAKLRAALCLPQQKLVRFDSETGESVYQKLPAFFSEGIDASSIENKKMPSYTGKASFLDAWMAKIDYREGSDHSKFGGVDLTESYDLCSAGPDGKFQEEGSSEFDDIVNWTQNSEIMPKVEENDKK